MKKLDRFWVNWILVFVLAGGLAAAAFLIAFWINDQEMYRWCHEADLKTGLQIRRNDYQCRAYRLQR